jgi:hypothetical protein
LTPVYTWNASAGATSYDLYIAKNGVSATTNYLSMVCVAGVCSVTSPALNNNDSVYWVVRARNSAGISAWSASRSFIVNIVSVPAIPTLVSPSGTIATLTPVYTWNASAGATSYDLYTDIGGVSTTTNYLAASACTAGTCSAISPTLANGSSVYWVVRAKNPAGTSAWSSSKFFTVNAVVVPAVPATVSPSGTVTTLTPSYIWNASEGATSYDLFTDIGGVSTTTNYLAASTCAAGTCSAISPTLANGSSVYWIVRAKNSAGSSAWSSSKIFHVVYP